MLHEENKNHFITLHQKNGLKCSLSETYDQFLQFFKLLYDYSEQVSPKVEEFLELILKNNENFNSENILKFNIINFIISFINMKSPENVLIASLEIISEFIYYSDTLKNSLFYPDLFESMQFIFTYPSTIIRKQILMIYVNLTDLDYTTFDLIEQAKNSFFEQAVYWSSSLNDLECRKKCLVFIYNIVVGSSSLTISEIQNLLKLLISFLNHEDDELIPNSCWCLIYIFKFYDIEIEFTDLYLCIWNVINTSATANLLQVLVMALSKITEFPNDLFDKIDFHLLFLFLQSSNKEIQIYSCKFLSFLMNGGKQYVDILFDYPFLSISEKILQVGSYKSQFYILCVLKAIFDQGNSEQHICILSHPLFQNMLIFIEQSELSKIIYLLQSILISLTSLTTDQLYYLFKVFLQNDIFDTLNLISSSLDETKSQLSLKILSLFDNFN